MDNQTSVPQDMWPEDEPIRPKSVPTSQPLVAPQVPTPAAPMPMLPKSPRKRAGWVTWVVTIVILAIVALGGGYAFGKYWPQIQSWFKKLVPANETVQTGPVAWQAIQPIPALGLMKDIHEEGTPGYSSSEDPYSLSRYYKVGKFIEGPYKDSELIVADLVLGGMGPARGVARIVRKLDGSLVVLGRHSLDFSEWRTTSQGGYIAEGDEDDIFNWNKFTIDSSYLIPDLELPDKITNPADDQQAIYYYSPNIGFRVSNTQVIKNTVFYQPEKWIEVFKNPINGLPIMTNPKPSRVYDPSVPTDPGGEDGYLHGFYVELPDGTFLTYVMKPTFMMSGSDSSSWSGAGMPDVLWTDTGKDILNTDEYSMATIGGCGAINYAAVMPDSLIPKLVVMGKIGNTEAEYIYKLNDSNDQVLKDLYSTYKEVAQAIGGKVMTHSQFLAKHPIFFWKDPFGRLIKFTRKDILPMAECGKPVIYLYPERATRVSVKVNPVGGFSFTDPDYGTGWDVIAQPNGALMEVKSNKTYPYLFWEGRGGLYQAPTKGWVIKQAEVSSFLDNKLAQLGLNAKETADFKEFWLPRMQSAPYYFVGFWDNTMMDQIAPLNITPKPDTIVRILMDFKPLQRPITVKAPTIKTPERRGFTVVEWGGVIQ